MSSKHFYDISRLAFCLLPYPQTELNKEGHQLVFLLALFFVRTAAVRWSVSQSTNSSSFCYFCCCGGLNSRVPRPAWFPSYSHLFMTSFASFAMRTTVTKAIKVREHGLDGQPTLKSRCSNSLKNNVLLSHT